MIAPLSPCDEARIGVRTPLPQATPIAWTGAPASRMALDSQPLGIDPSGRARWLVRVRFIDSQGGATGLLHGGDIEFYASHGSAQWQTRTRFGGPAAIVTTQTDGPLAVRAVAADPSVLGEARAETDTRRWDTPRVVTEPLGPHLVQLGWFPAASRGPVVVTRRGPGGTRTVCSPGPPSSTCRDTRVLPGAAYEYVVTRPGAGKTALRVQVPPETPLQSLAAVNGKGMWLSFSPDSRDDDSYATLDAPAIVDRAARAGLRYIELRLAYGEFWEITPDAEPAVDALIDAAAARGIAVVGWTVPREASFEDLTTSVAAANYRTPRGTRLAGVAVDLERGGEFMGDGRAGYASLAQYPRLLRAALGPRAVVIATVEDPYFERLTDRDVPYSAIAASASALQPMAYWRLFPTRDAGVAATRRALRGSFAAVRREARRRIPINVGGQTSDLGPCGPAPADEIVGSLAESRRLGALGETFFDWKGTLPAQWGAIGSFPW
ncbi:MAG: hypothetical protein ACLPYS_16705 [Vulcanimicrobiaceae bacterium]